MQDAVDVGDGLQHFSVGNGRSNAGVKGGPKNVHSRRTNNGDARTDDSGLGNGAGSLGRGRRIENQRQMIDLGLG